MKKLLVAGLLLIALLLLPAIISAQTAPLLITNVNSASTTISWSGGSGQLDLRDRDDSYSGLVDFGFFNSIQEYRDRRSADSPRSLILLYNMNIWATAPEGTITLNYDAGKTITIYAPEMPRTGTAVYLYVAEDGSTYYNSELTNLARAAPAPILTITYPIGEQCLSSTDVTITWTASNANEFSINQAYEPDVWSSWFSSPLQYKYTLEDGINTVTVRARADASSPAVEDSVIFQVDTTQPYIDYNGIYFYTSPQLLNVDFYDDGCGIRNIDYRFKVGGELSDWIDLVAFESSGTTLYADTFDVSANAPEGVSIIQFRVEDMVGIWYMDSGLVEYTKAAGTSPTTPPTCTDSDADGYAAEGGDCGAVDCDDTNRRIYPSAPNTYCDCDAADGFTTGTSEVYDTKDNDCDGHVDEGFFVDLITLNFLLSPNSLVLNDPASGTSTLSATISNIGNLNAGQFNVAFTAWKCNIFDVAFGEESCVATTIATNAIEALPANTEQIETASWTPTEAGDYDVCVFADSGNTIIESSESNIWELFTGSGSVDNTACFAATVTAPPPSTCPSNSHTCPMSETDIIPDTLCCCDDNYQLSQDQLSCVAVPPSCIDSDGGLNYDVYGVANKGIEGVYDCCKASAEGGPCQISSIYLFEAYCDSNGNLASTEYACPNGCQEGACLQAAACTDSDKDSYQGYDATNCPAGTDCNDANVNVHPGATEILDNQVDEDCDTFVDENCGGCKDEDKDGYGELGYDLSGCSKSTTEGDCNDNDAARNPGETEVCGDDKDNDCDGIIDDGCNSCKDEDEDSYGQWNYDISGCSGSTEMGDCDDNDASRNPGATEVCENNKDEDCDWIINNGCGTCKDEDKDGYGEWGYDISGCSGSTTNYDCFDNYEWDDSTICNEPIDCAQAQFSICAKCIHPGATEVCDDYSNNCEYPVDEGCECKDEDKDNYGIWGFDLSKCSGSTEIGDCDDNDATRSPGETEVCGDNRDNDCDWVIDDGCGQAIVGCAECTDLDKDGYGAKGTDLSQCSKSTTKSDCDDGNAARNPDTTEICNGADDNCNGIVDEGCTCTGSQTQECYSGAVASIGKGICLTGTQTCTNGAWGACVGEVIPADEIAGNGLDDNCNGQIDEITTLAECTSGEEKACYTGSAETKNKGECKEGIQTCISGQWSGCTGDVKPIEEIAGNSKDDDCDSQTDEVTVSQPSSSGTSSSGGGGGGGGRGISHTTSCIGYDTFSHNCQSGEPDKLLGAPQACCCNDGYEISSGHCKKPAPTPAVVPTPTPAPKPTPAPAPAPEKKTPAWFWSVTALAVIVILLAVFYFKKDKILDLFRPVASDTSFGEPGYPDFEGISGKIKSSFKKAAEEIEEHIPQIPKAFTESLPSISSKLRRSLPTLSELAGEVDEHLPALKKWIDLAMAEGYGSDALRTLLRKAGWDEETINKLLNQFNLGNK